MSSTHQACETKNGSSDYLNTQRRSVLNALNPISRNEFLDFYSSDPAALGFVDFLFDRPVHFTQSSDLSNAHNATLAILFALQADDENLFHKAYNELSRRQPQSDAPWLLNDLLFYGLVLGALQFNIDRQWLQNALLSRKELTKGELLNITITLLDILSENWGNTANIRPVILVARYCLGLKITDSDLLNDSYRMVTETPFPYCESNFLNTIYLRSFDVIILSKAPENPEKRKAINDLVDSLWEKANTTGQVLWWTGLILFTVLALTAVSIVKGLPDESEIKRWIITLDLLGFPLIAALPCVPWTIYRKKIIQTIQHVTLTKLFNIPPETLPPTNFTETKTQSTPKG